MIVLYYSDLLLLYSSLEYLGYMDYTQEQQSGNLSKQPTTNQPLILDIASWCNLLNKFSFSRMLSATTFGIAAYSFQILGLHQAKNILGKY